ncbi:hypothetical protein [Streptomyces mirabilis]
MSGKVKRDLFVSVGALAFAAGLTTPALAAETDTPAPISESSVSAEDSASAAELSVEDTLSGLPDVGEDGGVGPLRCDNPYKTWMEITSKKAYHVPSWWNGSQFKDGPGGTMTVKVEKAGKISLSVTGGWEGETKFIVAKAKVKVDVNVTGEVGITVGHQYSRDVARGKYGHLQYGSWGYKVDWARYETSPDRCGKRKVRSGKATLPTTETGWRYWETNS